jgi:hypothetical protein
MRDLTYRTSQLGGCTNCSGEGWKAYFLHLEDVANKRGEAATSAKGLLKNLISSGS